MTEQRGSLHPAWHARRAPDRPAIIMAETGEMTTYRDLDSMSNRVAQYFRTNGLGFGARIAILLENHPRYLEVCWGAQRCGLLFTPLSVRFTADEITYILNDSGAEALVTSRRQAAIAGAAADRAPRVRLRLMMDGATEGFLSYEDAVAAQPAVPIADEVAGTELMYSSGTTGRPKGILKSQARQPIDSGTGMYVRTAHLYHWSEKMVYLSTAPLYHAAPLKFCMSVGCAGGTVVLMERFDAERALALVERYHVTHTQWVPTMMIRLLRLPDDVKRRYDLSSHRYAIHAAAPCPVSIKEQMIEWWGSILHEYYGAAEGNGLTAIDAEEWLAHKGSVGKAVSGVIHILDDDGNALPPGSIGTVYFDGPAFAYLNDPEKTAASRLANGWTTVGDVGYVDNEGYLYLTDRRAFTIISGGVNIYPQEVENLLAAHPKVADAAVVGIPDAEFGEAVHAVVQPISRADAGPKLAAELIAHCRSHLAHYKCPKAVDFDHDLPREPTGKLRKGLIRDRYWQGRATRIN